MMIALEYLLLGVSISSAYLLIARIKRWHDDVVWCDGYRFARSRLAEGHVIMPHERGTGVFADGVLAAEEDFRTWHAALPSDLHSTAATS
jgi:hypothetical protein